MLVVLDEHAENVAGRIEIAADETQWLFRPRQPWHAGDYAVLVNATLEDRAGNNFQRLFDEDVSRRRPTWPSSVASIRFPFKIR